MWRRMTLLEKEVKVEKCEKRSRSSHILDDSTWEHFNIEIFRPNDSGEVQIYIYFRLKSIRVEPVNREKQHSLETKQILRNSSDRRSKTIKKRIVDLFIPIDSLLILEALKQKAT